MTRGLWSRETVALMLLAAVFPLAMIWIWTEGLDAIFRLVLAEFIIAAWHLIFMLSRAQPPSLSAMVTALAVAMLAPEGLSVFQLALGVSFGVAMGELVFGGWGRNVVNPATVTLAFLGFGFPTFSWPVFDEPVAWAAIPAGLIGMALGVMPAAVLWSAALVSGAASMAGGLPDAFILPAGIVLVLLVADPVTSAATTFGQWLYGALYVALVVLFAIGWAGAAPLQAAVAAALIASLAAPLLDEFALSLWVYRRRRRHGRT